MKTALSFDIQVRQRFTAWYLLLFYLLAAMHFMTGMWMHQMQPVFFNTRFDGFTWILMATDMHRWLLSNPAGQWAMDILFYGWPLIYFFVYRKSTVVCVVAGVVWVAINWLYVQCYTLYPTNSIEGHIAWLLFPVVFSFSGIRSFAFGIAGLRYFFIYFFVSAAIWKAVQGGLFNPQQMTGILLEHHKEFLLADPNHWQSRFIYFIAQRWWLGYALYWLGTVLELAFVVGLFTRRYDHWLIRATILFLAMDLLVMRIPYFTILPFMLCFAFSRYQPASLADVE